MRMTLLNQRPELGSCKTQKTKLQNVLNRILLALFAILFLPMGAWGQEDSYFAINTSSGNTYVTDGNAANIWGDGTMSYDITNNILTLNGINLSFTSDYFSDAFIAMVDQDHPTLTVRLVGNNTLTIGDKACVFNGWGITFTTDTSNPGTLSINTGDNWGGALFIDNPTHDPINATYNNGLSLSQNGNTYTIQTPVSYNITVAGTAVTSANASNVLNDDYSSVSYNATTNTLTLKGVHLDSATGDNNISATSALTIHLEGYSTVGTINVNDVTFTTNVSLPGRLRYTSISGNTTYENGLQSGTDSNNKNIIYSSSTNPYIIYATGYKFKDYDDTFYYWYDNGDIQGWSNEDYAAASLDVSSDLYVVGSQNNAKIDYFKVSTTSTNPTSCYLYPASLDDMNLVNKVYFLFDWGTCTNKNVKIQVRGLKSDFTNDGTYSNEVSLPSNGGLVEIPLTGTVNSYYFQIYFSSSTGEFSFIPISVGFLKTEGYGLTVAGVEVTADNASNITGANIQGTVSYDVENHKLTLNGVTLTSPIHWGTDEDLTIELKGTNSMNTSGVCISSEYDTRNIIFTGGDNNCSLELSTVTDDYFFSGFSNTDNPSMGSGMYWIPTWDDGTITSALITNSILGGGKGTEELPFIISSFEHLKTFAKYVNDGILSTEYIKLGGNIDCTNLTGFEPIGNNTKSFIGTFNGDGNSITGLTFSNTNPNGVSGLFGEIGSIDTNNDAITRGTVKNLTLNGCQFGNGGQNGAIAGYLHYGTIENCTVTSCTISSGNSQSTYSGGITGMVYNGIVKDCTVNGGTITSSITNSGDGYVYAGGIVAYAYSDSNINGCTVTDVSINSTGNGQNSYSGGIVGYSEATISGNSVKGTTTVNSSNNDNIETLVGAIVANRADGSFTNNYYYYTVKTKTTIGSNDPVEKSGYTQRASGTEIIMQDVTYYDIVENDGAVMYTKALTVGVNSECNFYEPLSDSSKGILALAPGQTVEIDLYPAEGTITATSLVYTPTGGTEQTVALTNIADPGYYGYSFEMPDANATLNATIVQTYDLWIGETQVTSANAANVLGNGTVSFSENVGADTGSTYKLTLNGATLTVPVKVGLDNLTIDIQGTNSITTNTTCIQKTDGDNVPSLTFTSTSDVVGSLTLKDTDEGGTNGVISSSYFGHFTINKKLALILLRSGDYTSNTYYFSAGEVHNAQLVPSYGVQVNDMQVYEGNATNVLGDNKVSFDKSSHTLKLNNVSGIEAISTTLSTLDIDLIGSNSLYRSSDGSIFESASGEAVTINLKSTGATKGSLTMEAPKSNGATLKGDNVTLTPVDPIVLLSSDVTENKGTLVYGVSYELTVSGVSVTSANASAIQTDAEFIAVEDGGSVTFDTATSTLTLNNAHLKHGIVSGLDNLKIRFQGTNKINSDSQVDNMDIQGSAQSNAISSSLETATLTFEKTGDGTIELYAKTFSYDPVVSGFTSVNYGSGDYQCYVQSSVPSYYDGTGKRLVNFYDVKGVTNATITSVASYPLWIGSGNFIQVTSANSEGITGTAIESGNVSFVPSDNKLKLKNAAITSKILSGLTNLTIDVEGNCSVIIPDSGSVVRSVVAGALTITKTGTNASLRLKNVVQDTYYSVIERFSSLTYTDFNLDTETSATYGQFGLGMNGDNAQIFDVYGLYNPDETESYKKGITSATFTTATLYPLWVGGVHVTSDIASSITGGAISVNSGGSVSYDAENNILTLNNVNFYTGDSAPIIESGLDALTVNVVGPVLFNFNDVNPAYVFKSTNANGVLTFTTTDASTAEIQIPRGIAAGAFTGFKTVSYKNGLALRTVAGDVPKYYIAPMVAPSFGAFSLNAETGDFTGTITTTYNYEGATIKYSIDYADDHEDVSNAVYGTSVVMKGPGTLTAYIAVGESTSPMTTAKWFAFTSHEIQGIKGQTSVAVPAVIPTIATTDNITVTYGSNAATIASISEGNITFNGVGATTIRGSFTTTGTVPFTVLNTGTYFDEIAVTVVPPAPVIAYDDTKTYLSTDKIEISLDPTYAAAPSGSNTIYYSWAENPTTGTVYPEGGVAVQTGTLTAWVVATVSDVNYESAKATQPFIVLVDPELAYKQGETSVTTATWTIDGTNNTALPVLQNTHSVAVTYASDNTAVATVANDGTVTVIGAGTAKITATAAATDVSAADEAYYTLTVNRQLNVNFSASNEWATYYGTENLATPTGLKAYQVTAVNGSTVTTSEIGYIPANTAVLLQNIEGKTAATNTIASAYTGATSTFPNNLLIGSTEAVGVSSINGGTVYVLYNDMFKRATSGTIPANRAYLVISGAAPARLNIVHGGDETGIDNIRMDEPNDSWYTIDGRKLNGQPQRAGFYIRNGKKVYKR